MEGEECSGCRAETISEAPQNILILLETGGQRKVSMPINTFLISALPCIAFLDAYVYTHVCTSVGTFGRLCDESFP